MNTILRAVVSTHISLLDWLAIGISVVVMVGTSYATAIPDYARIKGLTFSTASEEDRRRTRESWHWTDVVPSSEVMVFIIGAYLYFRG
jgi:SSS family solute:Na+ symporter